MQSAWIEEQQVSIEDGEIAGYRVNLMITFVMDDNDELDEDKDEDDEEA